MSETNQYHYGTPNIEEWGALWKDSIHDKDAVEDEEFDLAYRSLESCLAKIGKVGFERGSDFYVLGDSYGDRTQDIQLVNPDSLTREFLEHVQQWIQTSHPKWRVVVPVCAMGQKHAVVIYKDVIRLPSEFEPDIQQGLSLIRAGLSGK